jgi:hypothetical protein
MVDRATVREAFVSEAEAAVSGLSPTPPVRNVNSDLDADRFVVAYDDTYVPLEYNGATTAPYAVQRTASGDIDYVEYRSYIEAQFACYVSGPDGGEQHREAIHEAVRRRFERYRHDPWDAADLHSDSIYVSVHGSDSTDLTGTEPVTRNDVLDVRIAWYRTYTVSGDHIESIDRTTQQN